MKIYRTFDEIDRDLRILKLQSKIEREEIRSSFSEIKEDFSPVSMAANFIASLTKKAILFKTVASIFRMGRK
ncbi:MAG TPA: DUF6327 family protein [Flavobacteriaceae bacterium]|nr:DUF6327 family protein [Flavobacteriaceae bacterium]